MDRRTISHALPAALLICIAIGLFAAEDTRAPLRRDVLIGQGSAVFSEEYLVNFTRLEDTLYLDLPLEADPGSLFVGDSRGTIQWIETRWTASRPPAFDGVLELNEFGIPRAELAPPRGALQVECTLRADSTRPRTLYAIYQASNLSWRARYDMSIRGDISNQLEPLSLDLEARYYLSNGLARAISATRVYLRGPERLNSEAGSAPAGPGFLLLDTESPLADRWRPGRPPPEVPQRYTLSDPVTLAAGEVTAVRFASARRIPTDRVYVMNSEDIPIGSAPIWKPLTQILSFRNTARVGLGLPLPAGVAWISTGGSRTAFREEALLNHTSAGEAIRVNLGPATGVLGARRSYGRVEAASGFTEETIELKIQNNANSAIHVEIDERPPAPLAWDMVRSSHTYEMQDRLLHYELDIKPRSESIISYTIRVSEPAK